MKSVGARRVDRPKPRELVSLAERIVALTMLRLGFGVATLVVAILAPATDGAPIGRIATIVIAYAVATALAAASGRLPRSYALPSIALSLLVDGIFLAWVVQATGGFDGRLAIAPALHVLAVTLIASARTGFKVALWHTLLALVVVYGQRAGLSLVEAQPGGEDAMAFALLDLAALWAVGLVGAGFAHLQERELRAQKAHLERMSSMVGRLQRAPSAPALPAILLDALADAFGVVRGVVLVRRDDDIVVAATRGSSEVAAAPVGPDRVIEEAWTAEHAVLRRRLDPDDDRRLAELLPGAANVIVAPMLSRGGVAIGAVAVEVSARRARIRRWVVAFVEQFVAHAALSLHTAWLVEELHDRLEENRFLQRRLVSQNEDLEMRVEERTNELSERLRELRAVDDDRRRLLRKLVDAQEEERQRLAGDIHDDSVQKMVAASMRLQMLRRASDDETLREELDKLLVHVKDSITSMRHLIFQLRPSVLDDEGLACALEEHIHRMGEELTFDLRNQLADEPPADTRVILYRIAQEALANVRKHARAQSVKIVLKPHDDGFLIRITDDGRGFTASDVPRSAPGHLGLTSMRERAEIAGGWCRVHSLPGVGTTVEFWLPAVLSTSQAAHVPDTGDDAIDAQGRHPADAAIEAVVS